MKPDVTHIKQVIDRHLPKASTDEARIAGARVWHRLRTSGDHAENLEARVDEAQPAAGREWRGLPLAAAAALVIATAVGTAVLWRTDDSLYRVVEGRVQDGGPPSLLRSFGGTGTVRSNGISAGAVLALSDGSRIEMRSHTELSIERADDGMRIRLQRGGIIVNAAKQRTGHLYVHTKDVTVSVVGTVFLVNADERGSRVAVIEGEVRVQEGGTEKTLLPGEQVATNAQLPSPVRESIAWSRNAAALTALLQQVEVVPPAVTAQNPAAAREAFEVASIRPTRFAPGGERGAGAGGGKPSPRPAGEPCGSTGSSFLQFDPRRVAINDMTLYGLVAWAYDLPCRPWVGSHVLVGGPGWVRSDGYDIEALFPDGPPAYTSSEIAGPGGKTFTRQTMGPRFRTLLQTLLADRFGLVLRREKREVPVYALTVAPGGARVTAWKEGDPTGVVEYTAWHARNGTLLSEEQLSLTGMTAAEVVELSTTNFNQLEARVFRAYRDAGIRPLYTLADAKVPVSSLAQMIDRTFANENWRPVVDRTGITGPINYLVRYDRNPAPDAVGPSIFSALEKDLGLRLAPATAPMEVFVIERAERPSEN